MDRAARRREPEVWDPGTFRTRSGGAGTAQIRRGAQETPPSLTPEEIARYRAYVRAKRAERERIRRIEAERERRRQEQERLMRKKRRRRARKVFGARLILFLVILLLVAGVTALGLVIAFHHTSESGGGSGRVVYLYGGREARTVSRSAAEQNGVLYFCFNDLSDYLGLAESGSARAMKFVFPTGEETDSAGDGRAESVVFLTGTADADAGGTAVEMETASFLSGEEIWVPVSFAERCMVGLSVTVSRSGNRVEVDRIVDTDATETARNRAMMGGVSKNDAEAIVLYEPAGLAFKPSEPFVRIPESVTIGDTVIPPDTQYELEFLADLSEYETYMDPKGVERDAYLTVASAESPLSAGNVPYDLTDVWYTSYTYETKEQMRLNAAMSVNALFLEMYAENYYNMAVFAGYTSYEAQAATFEAYVNDVMANNPGIDRANAEAIASNYAARAGESDYQTGLAVAMDTMGTYSVAFADTEEYKWLTDNAWKFGFILRYPADKAAVTGHTFEPWHYRYVGRYHAKKIHDAGLCLEEYLTLLGR